MAEANQAPRCRHIKASGVRCGAPALRDREFCYFHNHTHNGARLIYPSLSRLEDAHGIQVALMEVLTGILDGRLDNKTGALLLYGLQTAVANLKHMPEIDPAEITTGEPEPEPRPSRDPQGDRAAALEAEKAAAAEGVRTTYERLTARHHIPGRPSGDTAREAGYAELMANYYRYDPDAPPAVHDECVDPGDSPAPHPPAAKAEDKRRRSCRVEALLHASAPENYGDSGDYGNSGDDSGARCTVHDSPARSAPLDRTG